MPPIRLHKDAPIAPTTAQTVDGITPKTTSDSDSTENQQPPPTRTTPAHVPATTTSQPSNNPPPPQPGARPLAPTASASTHDNASSVPPPPQPGSYTAHHITTETRLHQVPMPSQTTLPPPSTSNLATRSTTTSTTPSYAAPAPVTLNGGAGPAAASPYQPAHTGGAMVPPSEPSRERTSLEHPPGYVQAPDNSPYAPMRSGNESSGGGGGGGDEGVGAAAWNMLAKAGEALRKGEEAAWKAVTK